VLEVEPQPPLRAAEADRAELGSVCVNPVALDAERARECGGVDIASWYLCGSAEQLCGAACDRLDVVRLELQRSSSAAQCAIRARAMAA
jgi:hypothetical protein